MKRIVAASVVMLFLFSCATTVKFNANQQDGDYLNIVEALLKSNKTKLTLGKQEQYLLSPSSSHLYDKEEDYRTAITIFEANLEKEGDYSIDIISLPNSLGNNPTIMDPILNVFNSENIPIQVELTKNEYAQTQLLNDKSIYKKYRIEINKPGTYSFIVLANLDTENGIIIEQKEKDGKIIRNQEMKVTPYGRFKLIISEE